MDVDFESLSPSCVTHLNQLNVYSLHFLICKDPLQAVFGIQFLA